ncbi:AI-2E family transporter [Akkermansia glycaniphila]|uniref:AI-2E family transporter n=1 Tax=Akkermansia glycaniphila TaxID=1679444 RepID=UPI001C01B696|nr:AI-2E family transporter [Akkermansia glycaniphila]MBT9450445.1 AI-2E family transporter [Akkermansia glycaniphila]
MTSCTNTPLGDGRRVLVTIAAAFIVFAGLQAARDIIVPIILASFLAIASYPITVSLRKYLHFPHWLAVCFTVLVDFGFLIGLGFLINFLAKDLSIEVQTTYQPLFETKYNDLMLFLRDHGLDTFVQEKLGSAQDILSAGVIMSITTAIMGKALGFIAITTLVLILMTFFLGEAPRFRSNVDKITASRGCPNIRKFADALQGIQRYLVIKTLISLTTGILAWGLCKYMDVGFALLWGIVAFALNFIPTFGSIVAAIPPILLALLIGGISDAVIVAFGYIVINFMLGNGIEPLLLGKQFGIATSVVLLSVILWGWIWGPIGMLLAVPISVLVKLALENSKDLKWIAMMIDNPPTTIPLPKIPPYTVDPGNGPDKGPHKS